MLLKRILLALLLLSLPLWGCALPQVLTTRLFPSPTPSLTPTATHTLMPSPTASPSATPTASQTPTATLTPTQTLIPPTATYSPTPTQTPVPPTLTPGPDEITAGQDAWRLLLVDSPRTIQAQGGVYYPGKDGAFYQTYAFIRLNFACLTNTPLLGMYTQSDLGLLFAYRPDGIPGVMLHNPGGNSYPVTLMGTCWLAASLPRTDLSGGEYTLLFQDLPAFQFTLTGLP